MAVAEPVKRDCHCPKAKHEHGTIQAYVRDKCRCTPCRAANARRRYLSDKRIAFGRGRPAHVDGTGTRRRLQALATQGWSFATLSRRVGLSTDRLWQVATGVDGPNVSVVNEVRVRRLYDALWDKKAPCMTHGERTVYFRTIQRARRNGWAPPLAWDDIDDPDETPKGIALAS